MATLKNDHTKLQVALFDEEGHTRQGIAEMLDIPVSTVKDFLLKNTHIGWWDRYEEGEIDKGGLIKGVDAATTMDTKETQVVHKTTVEPVRILTSNYCPNGCDHFMIPDTQAKPDVNFDYMEWIGKYIVDRKPQVIVHIGDHADMESLSSYDKGKKKAEGKRLHKDIDAAIESMNRLLQPIKDLQDRELAEYGEVRYKPYMVLTLGNHEYRIMRHVDANPELSGFLSYDNLRYHDMGWEVHDFLKPVMINGVTYVHFMANPMSGKPYGGSAMNILKNVGESFTVGHKQTLDIATRFLPSSGRQQWAIILGACYLHDEDYKGYQGNKHFRGLVVKHYVEDGSYCPMFVDLAYLGRRYGGGG
jgi:hypothetical protein